MKRKTQIVKIDLTTVKINRPNRVIKCTFSSKFDLSTEFNINDHYTDNGIHYFEHYLYNESESEEFHIKFKEWLEKILIIDYGFNVYQRETSYKDQDTNVRYSYRYNYDTMIKCDFCHKSNPVSAFTDSDEDDTVDICPNCGEDSSVLIEFEHLNDYKIDEMIKNKEIIIL